MFKFSVFDIPELHGLSPRLRRRLVRAWFKTTRWNDIANLLVLLAVVFGMLFLPAIYAAAFDYGLNRTLRWCIVVTIMSFGLTVELSVLGWFIRGEVSDFVRREFPRIGSAFCVNCDYDLRGTTGDRCPECGEWRPSSPDGEHSATGSGGGEGDSAQAPLTRYSDE